jgi:hypothetical protein
LRFLTKFRKQWLKMKLRNHLFSLDMLGLTFDDVSCRYTWWMDLRGEGRTGSRFPVSFKFVYRK